MLNVLIKEATDSNLDKIMALSKAVTEEHVLPLFSAEGREFYYSTHEKEDATICDKSKYLTYVALVENELAGCIAIRQDHYIAHLYVKTELQGKGIGRMLLDIVSSAATRPYLKVSSSINAVGFYSKYGFEAQGPEHIFHGIRTVPMELKLTT